MKYTIGLKIGSKYGFGDVKSLIKKGIAWGFNFFEITVSDLDQIGFYQNLTKQGIKFGVHVPHAFTPQNPVALCATISPYQEEAERWFKKSINLAQKLQAEYLVIHPDLPKILEGNSRYPEGMIFAKTRQSGFDRLIKLIRNYRGNIALLAELMPNSDYYNHNLAGSLKLKKLTGINFCFDIDHAFEVDRNIKSVINWYQGIKNWVKIFHICDYDPKIRGHLPVGDGKINFEKFFKSNKLDSNQKFILEVLPYSAKSMEKDIVGSREKLIKLLKNEKN